MKKFLYKIFLFTLLGLVCAFGLDFFLSYRLRQSNSRVFASWNQIYSDSICYDIVVNGNSRAWVQYDPLVLDSILDVNSFNLGIDGSAINRQIIKYKKYCELHGNPKCLIQNIDLRTMDITHGYEIEQIFSYFFYDRKLIEQYDQYEKFSFGEKYIPCYRYIGYDDVISEALFYDRKHLYEHLTKGFFGRDNIWDGSALHKTDSIICDVDTNALNLFIEFLQEETDSGVKIIFVYAPIYIGAREKMVNEEEMFAMYDSIAKKFDIPILDYNDISLCYDTAYFYNATHLNRVGAELFTTKLAHDIDSLGLLK